MSAVWWFDDEDDRGRLLSIDDATRLLGIPSGTIRSWVCRHQLEPGDVVSTKRGKGRRYRSLFWERDLRALAGGDPSLSTR